MNKPVLKAETHILMGSVLAPKYPLMHVYLSGILGAVFYLFLMDTPAENIIFVPFIFYLAGA
jgi:hypothetical protein